jgi:uncharacterized protein (DUF697 family)
MTDAQRDAVENPENALAVALHEKLQGVKSRDKAADKTIQTAIYTNAAMGVVPFGVNFALFVGTSAIMVMALGNNYGYTMNKEQAAALVKQMFMAAGFTFGGLVIGSKVGAEFLKVTGLGTLAGMALDAVLAGSVTYALGYTAKTYFEKGCQLDKAEMGAIIRAKRKEGMTAVKSGAMST